MLSKLSERYVGDMLRCLGDILASFSGNVSWFISGKMSERYVKMSERHVKVSERQFGIFFQARCLRAMLRCLGNMLR